MIPQWVETPKIISTTNLSPSTKTIASIDYSMLSPQDILLNSNAQIKNPQLYNQYRHPTKDGPLDPRLGVGNKSVLCSSCFLGIQHCVGHFGHIHLNLPIYHLGFFKNLITILKMVCKSCSRVLLEEEQLLSYIKKLKRYENNYFKRLTLFKKISKEAIKNKKCPHCGYINPIVQKIPKICAKVEIKSSTLKKQISQYKIKMGSKPQNQSGEFNYQLNPWEALKIISKVKVEQYPLLNMGQVNNIESFVPQDLPVPPVNIRPSVMLTNSLSNEDDLTMKIKDILFMNKKIHESMIMKGDEFTKIAKSWYLMQSHWSQYINTDSPGLPLFQLKTKSIRSLITRLKGKQGRFRQNLSGKRSNYTARTVISPDPNLHPTQVIVPQHMAKILTIQETVTPQTIQMLQQCIQRGSQKKNGANFIITKNNEKILIGNQKAKIQLKYGDIVERHLRDNDIVIFNRQPSLHRISMMGFRVKVSPWKTLRFNECVCAPFNADFDGDQMNIHVPQTLQARSETFHLMGVAENIITPKSGEPIIALIQDFLTTSFLITSRDIFFKRQEFSQILSYITDADEKIDLPPPTIMKPVSLWTGKQVFSSILRPNRLSRVIVNFQTKEKIYTKNELMCERDGWVLFKNSELLSGQLGKNTLGGNKSGLIYALLKDNTADLACEAMHRIAKLSARWISNFGMTIGISDVKPTQKLFHINKQAITEAYQLYEKYLKDYEKGLLQAKPGMSVTQTLESYLNSTLSKVRQTVGDNCMANLHRFNKPLIMALCGSKGSAVNLAQMVGCLGQQTVGGKRISYGFTQRTTPHFPRLSQTPQARGFVKNSFYTGLTPTQFFFHTMGGREGIIDTAVKTADTGYMQRRLIKLIEDIGVMYDFTVRTCDRKQIIQFRYGDDGLNPMKTQESTNPVNLNNLQIYVKNILGSNTKKTNRGCQYYLKPQQILQRTQSYINNTITERKIIGLQQPFLQQLLDRVRKYFQEKVEKLKSDIEKIEKMNIRDQQNNTYLANCFNGITDKQLAYFFILYVKRINKTIIQPGQAIGALTAQSIGQPATQMTLKTFHFAGISSMNITQGVPRINQIINNAKNIATPIIQIYLINDTNKNEAITILNKAQRLRLQSILHSIQEIYALKDCTLNLILNIQTIKKMKINFSIQLLKQLIKNTFKTKIKSIEVLDAKTISIVPITKTNMMFELKSLRRNLVVLPISGIRTIDRALISTDKNKKYVIYAEGMGLKQVLAIQGVDTTKTFSNHITEIQSVLGIEAARNSIIKQISQTMKEHGVNVNPRHVNLLAQFMTCKGHIIGFTRNGIDKMKDSTLMLASFQKTADFLFDAAVQGKHDRLKGVSEKIIMGQPITVGTGMFDIKQNIHKSKIYGRK